MTLTQINKAGLDEIALDHVFTIGASGSSAYTFQGEGLNGTVNNPTLYLTRGKTYRFENGSGGHPIRIQSTSGASGTAYNTGVTNNAGSGTVIVEVQHDAPDVLYYQCTSHAAMNGILYITGALADGGVTTAKIADDAVNNDKLANSVVAAIAANTAKTTNATHTGEVTGSTALTIAHSAVTLEKLAHGTSSTDGKFLRSNNGAHPSFETVDTTTNLGINFFSDSATVTNSSGTNISITEASSSQAGLMSTTHHDKLDGIAAGATNSPTITINANGDNRILTGTGSANTIQGESQLLFDSNGLLYLRAPDGGNRYFFGETGNSQSAQLSLYNSSDQQKVRIAAGDGSSTGSTFFNGGSVGIGLTNPEAYDSYANQLVVYGAGHAGMTIRGNYANTGNIYFADGTSGGEKYDGYISYSYPTQRLSLGAGGNTIAKVTTDGICFGSDTSASNALDDYEEGTYNPTMSSGCTLHANNDTLAYVKIGRMVWVTGRIRINSDSYSGTLTMSVPFTANSGNDCSNCGHSFVTTHGVHFDLNSDSNYSGTDLGTLTAETITNTSYVYFIIPHENADWVGANSHHIDSNSYLAINHFYYT